MQEPEECFLQTLTNENGWIVAEVQRDHAIVSDFDGMEIFFSATEYKTNLSHSNVWPEAGEYYREDLSSRVLVRDDQNELFVSELDQNHLVILFDFKTFEPISGKAKSDKYSFTFIRHQ